MPAEGPPTGPSVGQGSHGAEPHADEELHQFPELNQLLEESHHPGPGLDSHHAESELHQPGPELHQPGLELHHPGLDSHQPGLDSHQPGLDSHHAESELHQPGLELHHSEPVEYGRVWVFIFTDTLP